MDTGSDETASGSGGSAQGDQASGDSAMTYELRGPYRIEQEILAKLPEMIARRDAETDRGKRKELNRRIKLARDFAKWCRTRAGYVVPVAEKGGRHFDSPPALTDGRLVAWKLGLQH